MAHPSSLNSDDTVAKLVFTKQASIEVEVPMYTKQADMQECVVCVQKSSENYDIYSTQTIALGTSIYSFLSKYSDHEFLLTSDVNVYICSTCLHLVNMLEQAELEFVKLKCTLEDIICNNPLFRKSISIPLVCKKEATLQEPGFDNTGPYSGNDAEAMEQSVKVKIERNNGDEEDADYGVLQEFVDTVMEPDPLDENIGFTDGAHHLLLDTQSGQISTLKQTIDRPYQCQTCFRTFAQKYQLREHEIIHTGGTPFQCKVCLRSYNQKGYLESHIQEDHADIKVYQCDHCPEWFTNISELRSHNKKHAGENFKCDICNCEFKRKDNYHRHLKTHSVDKERPFECDICQKRFVEKPHLTSHMAVHSGEKPFLCNVCQCGFNRKGNLQRHMLRHSGMKPFECEACHRRFSQKLHLQNHFARKHVLKTDTQGNKKSKRKKRRDKGSVLDKTQTVSDNFEEKDKDVHT